MSPALKAVISEGKEACRSNPISLPAWTTTCLRSSIRSAASAPNSLRTSFSLSEISFFAVSGTSTGDPAGPRNLSACSTASKKILVPIGFGRKATTPSFFASSSAFSVGWPVIKIARASGFNWRTFSTNSRPEIPGSRKSVTSKSTGPRPSSSSASSPEGTSTTTYSLPDNSRLDLNIRLTSR